MVKFHQHVFGMVEGKVNWLHRSIKEVSSKEKGSLANHPASRPKNKPYRAPSDWQRCFSMSF